MTYIANHFQKRMISIHTWNFRKRRSSESIIRCSTLVWRPHHLNSHLTSCWLLKGKKRQQLCDYRPQMMGSLAKSPSIGHIWIGFICHRYVYTLYAVITGSEVAIQLGPNGPRPVFVLLNFVGSSDSYEKSVLFLVYHVVQIAVFYNYYHSDGLDILNNVQHNLAHPLDRWQCP